MASGGVKTDDATRAAEPKGRLGRAVSRVVSDGSLSKKASLNDRPAMQIRAGLIEEAKRLGFEAGVSCHGTQMLDYIHELEGVTQPVCIIWGDQDHRAPPPVLGWWLRKWSALPPSTSSTSQLRPLPPRYISRPPRSWNTMDVQLATCKPRRFVRAAGGVARVRGAVALDDRDLLLQFGLLNVFLGLLRLLLGGLLACFLLSLLLFLVGLRLLLVALLLCLCARPLLQLLSFQILSRSRPNGFGMRPRFTYRPGGSSDEKSCFRTGIDVFCRLVRFCPDQRPRAGGNAEGKAEGPGEAAGRPGRRGSDSRGRSRR